MEAPPLFPSVYPPSITLMAIGPNPLCAVFKSSGAPADGGMGLRLPSCPCKRPQSVFRTAVRGSMGPGQGGLQGQAACVPTLGSMFCSCTLSSLTIVNKGPCFPSTLDPRPGTQHPAAWVS